MRNFAHIKLSGCYYLWVHRCGVARDRVKRWRARSRQSAQHEWLAAVAFAVDDRVLVATRGVALVPGVVVACPSAYN